MERLVGHDNFQRANPKSDFFPIHDFHHVEFWCPDAVSAYKRFQFSLGLTLVARSDLSTANKRFSSYVLKSNQLLFVFTAPNPDFIADAHADDQLGFDAQACREFVAAQGLGVRAVAVAVDDAAEAFRIAVENGASPVTYPRAARNASEQVVSEVELYGRTVLRFVSGNFSMHFMAEGYEAVPARREVGYGFTRVDHVVGNVPDLLKTVNRIMGFTGMHEFAEFTAEDVGTVDSGLNSVVMANNNERVLLPVNEPTEGRRQSQIQTYLDHNGGAGVQHVAISTSDIFATMDQLRRVGDVGGFEMMERPSEEYYRKIGGRIGEALTEKQYEEIERLGLLVDKDEQGVLIQIFTKPVTERPTLFFEFIQRLGCEEEAVQMGGGKMEVVQKGGCGGFGKGNFSELFKSIEEYEKTIGI